MIEPNEIKCTYIKIIGYNEVKCTYIKTIELNERNLIRPMKQNIHSLKRSSMQ